MINEKVKEKEEQIFTIAPNPGNGMFHVSYAPAQSNTLQVENNKYYWNLGLQQQHYNYRK